MREVSGLEMCISIRKVNSTILTLTSFFDTLPLKIELSVFGRLIYLMSTVTSDFATG